MKNLWKNYSLGIILFTLFVLSWVMQGAFQFFEVIQQAQAHHEVFKMAEFWVEFGAATFENWQSEFLQIFAIVVLSKYFRFQGSHESKSVETPNSQTE